MRGRQVEARGAVWIYVVHGKTVNLEPREVVDQHQFWQPSAGPRHPIKSRCQSRRDRRHLEGLRCGSRRAQNRGRSLSEIPVRTVPDPVATPERRLQTLRRRVEAAYEFAAYAGAHAYREPHEPRWEPGSIGRGAVAMEPYMAKAAAVLAYAAEPDRGSEPGAGWGVAKATSGALPVYLLTSTRRWERLRNVESDAVQPVAVDEPKPRVRLGRLGFFVSYIRWLPRARTAARLLVADGRVALVLHATFSTYWLPSPVVGLGVPAVWGPVGGAVTTPRSLWWALGIRGLLVEWLDAVAVRTAAWLPATRRTWRHADVRIVQNEETRRRLPARLHENTHVFNHACLVETRVASVRRPEPWLLWVSPMEDRKGGALVLHALARTPSDVRLRMAGDGPDRARLERIARRLGINHRVDFLGWIPRGELTELFATCAAVVFTGLREEGGLSLAETLYAGAPVVVLANGGARTIAERTTDPTRVVLVSPTDRSGTVAAMAAAMTEFSRHPPIGGGPLLDRESLVAEFRQLVMSALGE